MEGTESYWVASEAQTFFQDCGARLPSLGGFPAGRGGGSSTSPGHLVATG